MSSMAAVLAGMDTARRLKVVLSLSLDGKQTNFDGCKTLTACIKHELFHVQVHVRKAPSAKVTARTHPHPIF